MTNKHKKASTTKKAEKAAKMLDDAPVVLDQPGYMNFTRSQLASLVFLSVGGSKIMEFSTAFNQGHEDPTSCLEYLGQANEDVCFHPSFSSLILAKYYSGLSLAGYLLSGMIILWNSEALFLRFMTLMAVSPVATTTVATIARQVFLERGRVWHLLIVASVLYATIAPQSVFILPFMADRTFTPQTVQSKTLMGLAGLASWELFRVIFNGERDVANSLVDTGSPLPVAAKALVNFWMVDKLSMVLLYVFAMLHLPVPMQRGFLFFTAFIKLAEFFIQRSSMPEPFMDATMLDAATIASAVASAYGWYA